MKISICIPTWEQYGNGPKFLKHLLDTITKQTYSNFNVIISDHSLNEDILNLCRSYKDTLDILYIKNKNYLGNSPANTNNCILNSDGEIIKIMFQDDFFYDDRAMELISKEFKDENCNWLVSGCNHTYDNGKTYTNQMTPSWNDRIVIGVNTISSPSVLSFRKKSNVLFDQNLTMLMDCEMYHQLYMKYGTPRIISDCLITNRMHPNQISNMYQNDINKEIEYVRIKHNL